MGRLRTGVTFQSSKPRRAGWADGGAAGVGDAARLGVGVKGIAQVTALTVAQTQALRAAEPHCNRIDPLGGGIAAAVARRRR